MSQAKGKYNLLSVKNISETHLNISTNIVALNLHYKETVQENNYDNMQFVVLHKSVCDNKMVITETSCGCR